ncbi:hypothetical protein SAMN05444397_101714 [Flavobacterium aquidurense]|uniref:Uncharacterized protein n=1 Tax=Flavobacterium frigidimaris TaxID=262320 RepID=A0ABX4BTZ1_FLAFR|nr:hypothetical protein [Flavobacterium frigidimaris]OXA80988.1 hypothetical protein B0A65_05305 [Flavobacterium frigidimaris]SDY46688.1 hypothetical protein SAMN05444397_101714 [Flavobacterium aquidurense]
MNTTEQKNSTTSNRDPRNQNLKSADKNNLMNEELYDIDDMKEIDDDNAVIAERGYTVRNGHNPDGINPDEMIYDKKDIEDLDDDFHSKKDLIHTSDDLYDDAVDDDLDPAVDELDNPSDVREREDGDFNEVDDLEDIDPDDEDDDFEEEEIEEEDSEKDYPENDPRKF